MTPLTTNTTISAVEACKAVHAIADSLFDQLGADTLYTDGTGPVSYPPFQDSVENALLVALLNCKPDDFEDEETELLCDQDISINVERQKDGRLMYEVEFAPPGSDIGTNCSVRDLVRIDDWFEAEWITEAG